MSLACVAGGLPFPGVQGRPFGKVGETSPFEKNMIIGAQCLKPENDKRWVAKNVYGIDEFISKEFA